MRHLSLLTLVPAASRRAALGDVLAGGCAALLGRLGSDDAAARRKRRKRRRCKGASKRCGRKCIPKANCCGDAECGSGAACVEGACVCQADCCANADCGLDAACVGGACVCSSGFELCGEVCIRQDDCCTDDDCPAVATCIGRTCFCREPGQDLCGESCVDLATDAGNCGACGNACLGGECDHGACTCERASDCPGAGCSCFARKTPPPGGPVGACSGSPAGPCATDDDCPVGRVCLVVGFCSGPCVA